MKATYKRYLAAAFATVGLISLGAGQAVPNPLGPSQQGEFRSSQTSTNQVGNNTPDATQSQDVQSGPSVSDNAVGTDLGVNIGDVSTSLDTDNAPRIMINQADVTFADAQPGMINGQLMVPVREVAEQLGATVDWSNQDKQVLINLPSQQSITLNTNQDWLAMVNSDDQGRPLRFYGDTAENHLMLGDDEVILIGNRAYMPFDRVAAVVNGSGDWDQSANTATITTDVTTGGDHQVPDESGAPPPDNGTPSGSNTSPDRD